GPWQIATGTIRDYPEYAYLWDPTEIAEGVSREDIIGIEAPLWTETITNPEDLEYMVFPRVVGYAEIGWTAPEARSWEEYRERLAAHAEYLEAMDINYYQSRLIPWAAGHP
ncbi:MAG: family 20 glycosylhydrolase, partial [Cyclobacteriaceae bacterium]